MHGDMQGAHQPAGHTQTSLVTAPVSLGVGGSPRAPPQWVGRCHPEVLRGGHRDPCRAPGGSGGGGSSLGASVTCRLYPQAFSGLYHNLHFLNLTGGQSLSSVDATVKQFCNSSWEKVRSCLGGASPCPCFSWALGSPRAHPQPIPCYADGGWRELGGAQRSLDWERDGRAACSLPRPPGAQALLVFAPSCTVGLCPAVWVHPALVPAGSPPSFFHLRRCRRSSPP